MGIEDQGDDRALRRCAPRDSLRLVISMMHSTVDAKGLTCPLPILKAKKALMAMPGGALLEVLATDPGSIEDFQAFCRATGNNLVSQSEDQGVYRFVIARAG